MSATLTHFRSLFTVAICAPVFAMGQVADAGLDVLLCGNEYDMTANAPIPPGTGVWTSLYGCGMLVNPTDPNTHVVGMCIGLNIWSWTILDGSMNQTTDQVEITVFDDQAPPADAGQDVTITDLPGNMELNASNDPIPPMICTWTLVTGTSTIVDPHDPNTMVVGLGVGDNIFRWTCDNGPCGTTSDEVNIQFMMDTGIGTTAQDAAQLFRYDPRAQQLVIEGAKPIEDLMITDALGHSMPLDVGQLSTRTWNVAAYACGLYVLRALVDRRPQVYRFVVAR